MDEFDVLVQRAKEAVDALGKYLEDHQRSSCGPEAQTPETFWMHDAPDGFIWQGRFTSREAAEREGRRICTYNFSVSRMRVPKADEFFPSAEAICDLARENAEIDADIGDETIGDFALISKEAARELNELVSDWANKHIKVGFSVLDGELHRIVQNSDEGDVQGELFLVAEDKTNVRSD